MDGVNNCVHVGNEASMDMKQVAERLSFAGGFGSFILTVTAPAISDNFCRQTRPRS